ILLAALACLLFSSLSLSAFHRQRKRAIEQYLDIASFAGLAWPRLALRLRLKRSITSSWHMTNSSGHSSWIAYSHQSVRHSSVKTRYAWPAALLLWKSLLTKKAARR